MVMRKKISGLLIGGTYLAMLLSVVALVWVSLPCTRACAEGIKRLVMVSVCIVYFVGK